LENEDPIKLWQHIHGATAHFPIAMMVVGFLFDLGAIVFKRENWRTVGFWCLMIAAIVAVPLVVSGMAGGMGWFGIEKWMAEGTMKHRNVALIGSGLTILLALWRAVRRDALKGAEWGIFLLLLAAAVGGIGYAGFLGAYVARGY
jgi:uncharacterized membrane protein